MSDFSSNAPDQSYWDWLKQQLGVKQDSFAMPQISPSGLPASYDERIKNDQSPDLLAYKGVPTAQGSAITPAQASLLSQADQLGQGIQPASPMDATPMSDYRGAGIQAPVSQMDATPMSDYRGAGIQAPIPTAPASIASAPTTPALTIPTATAPAPVDPTANYINSSVFGLGAKVDPNGINPQTGLTNAQTQMMQYNMLGSVGAKLLAAGQNIMPAQRAQILGEIGNAASEPMTAMTQMQQRLLQNNKLARENAQQANFVKIMQSPETINAINNLPKEYQVSAKALAAAGTPEAFVKLQEYLAPHIQGNNIIDYSKGIVRNTDTQMETPIGTGNSAAGQNGSTSNFWTETDPEKAKALLPQRTQIMVDGIIDGSIAIPPISARNKDMTQYLMMAKKIDPTLDTSEMNGRSMIKKSFADSENKSSLFNQRSVLGTFAQHTNSTLDKAQKLNNGPLPAFDAVRNEFLNASGDPRVADFNTELHMLQGEVGKMVRAGVLTDQEQSALNANISAAKSPEQIRGVLDSYNELVSGRIAAVDSSTKAAMGKGYDPTKYSLITPETQKAFDKFNGNNWGRPQTQQNTNAPLKPGNYKYNPQTGQMELM